jgi:hypothetical protein
MSDVIEDCEASYTWLLLAGVVERLNQASRIRRTRIVRMRRYRLYARWTLRAARHSRRAVDRLVTRPQIHRNASLPLEGGEQFEDSVRQPVDVRQHYYVIGANGAKELQ